MALILTIEDDATQRLATTLSLRRAGHNILEVANGMDGLRLAKNNRPDVVVCDVVMPDISGYDVIRLLREDPDTVDIPIILLTAKGEQADIRSGMLHGADDYLTKPIRAADLHAAVMSLIAKRQQRSSVLIARVESTFAQTLEVQRAELERSMEAQWASRVHAAQGGHALRDREQTLPDAVILMTNSIGLLFSGMPDGEDLALALRSAYVSARDTLILYGAIHIQPYGGELLAIFPRESDRSVQHWELQAVKAGFALLEATRAAAVAEYRATHSQLRGQMGLTIALHQGPVRILRVEDPTYPGEFTTLVQGDAVLRARALRKWARSSGWTMLASESISNSLHEGVAFGKSDLVSGDARHALTRVTEIRLAEQPSEG